jgi:hypothetical protein
VIAEAPPPSRTPTPTGPAPVPLGAARDQFILAAGVIAVPLHQAGRSLGSHLMGRLMDARASLRAVKHAVSKDNAEDKPTAPPA